METDIIQEEFPWSPDIILYANPLSGSQKASEYLQLEKKQVKLIASSSIVTIHIYDLSSSDQRLQGAEKIKETLEASQKIVRVIVAGGDGSLAWTIEYLTDQSIPLASIVFGILPFGSGNDLSASFGWGRDPPSNLMEPYMTTWLDAVPRSLDIWTVKVKVHRSGVFGKVRKLEDSYEKYVIKNDVKKQLKIRKIMTNYFSIGLDARIGLGFDKHRTSSKFWNRFFYCWEGFKKMCCCVRTAKIPEIIQKITSKKEVIFDKDKKLDEETSVLLALNIRTYGGGENYVWDKSKEENRSWEGQSYSDNKIEVLAFPGKLSLGLEQIKWTQGQARRVEQSEGPFKISFTDTEKKCYFQIDGEYYFMLNPRSVRLKLWENSKDIKVLYKPDI